MTEKDFIYIETQLPKNAVVVNCTTGNYNCNVTLDIGFQQKGKLIFIPMEEITLEKISSYKQDGMSDIELSISKSLPEFSHSSCCDLHASKKWEALVDEQSDKVLYVLRHLPLAVLNRVAFKIMSERLRD